MQRINATSLLVEDEKTTESITKGGIHLPTAVTRPTQMRGKILVCGEGTVDIPMVHEVGSTAIYHFNSGHKFTYEDREVRLISVSDVFLSGV